MTHHTVPSYAIGIRLTKNKLRLASTIPNQAAFHELAAVSPYPTQKVRGTSEFKGPSNLVEFQLFQLSNTRLNNTL